MLLFAMRCTVFDCFPKMDALKLALNASWLVGFTPFIKMARYKHLLFACIRPALDLTSYFDGDEQCNLGNIQSRLAVGRIFSICIR
jgi:hypothetical protein